MKKIKKTLSAMALCTVFASMQIATASMDTGLNDAVINHTTGGFAGMETGDNSATLNFNGNSHVNWDSLNVGQGETLNFNAINGATGLTIVNTVNGGMTTVAGTINSNSGIAKLIISNPNGMLFDGATFTTAGDLTLTTQPLNVLVDGKDITIQGLNQETFGGVTIQNSDFTIGGEFNITAPTIEAITTVIKADKGFKLVTADGQNYLVAPTSSNDTDHTAVRLEAVQVDGDVYITSGKDLVKIVDGGRINGNLNINTDGNVSLNYVNNGNTLEVTKDVNVHNDGRISYLRNAKVGGNVNMSNSGGFLEIANVDVKGNVDLKTTVKTNESVKHFIHVVGDNNIGGNLNIDSAHNIHIGGYDNGLNHLAKGSLNVGGDLNAVARDGSIAVTIDTTADKVNLTSETLNIITDGKAVITANDYKFKAKHYIGGLASEKEIMNVMENYIPIKAVSEKSYLNIAGGNVSKLETDKDGFAFIKSQGDMNIDGVNAGKVNITAEQSDIKIGEDVHANLIVVGGETDDLTVSQLKSRDYTLKFTDIKDTEVITIGNNEEITYEKANGKYGWNTPEGKLNQKENNTYLVVPGPGPGPDPKPDPTPDPINPDHDPEKVIQKVTDNRVALDAGEVSTPIAFAADLDDEIDTGVRKNVDGSVTVVRAYTPGEKKSEMED